jgi:hypothetical protein
MYFGKKRVLEKYWKDFFNILKDFLKTLKKMRIKRNVRESERLIKKLWLFLKSELKDFKIIG